MLTAQQLRRQGAAVDERARQERYTRLQGEFLHKSLSHECLRRGGARLCRRRIGQGFQDARDKLFRILRIEIQGVVADNFAEYID